MILEIALKSKELSCYSLVLSHRETILASLFLKCNKCGASRTLQVRCGPRSQEVSNSNITQQSAKTQPAQSDRRRMVAGYDEMIFLLDSEHEDKEASVK